MLLTTRKKSHGSLSCFPRGERGSPCGRDRLTGILRFGLTINLQVSPHMFDPKCSGLLERDSFKVTSIHSSSVSHHLGTIEIAARPRR